MTHCKNQHSQRKPAIIAGTALVTMAFIAAFSYGFVLQSLATTSDPYPLAGNIKNASLLFRLGICGFLAILIADVVAAWALYVFFRQVNERLSLLAAWLRLIYTVFLAIAIGHLIQALTAAEISIGTGNIALVPLYLTAFYKVWSAGLVVFGIHLTFLGYLSLKATYVPKLVGILLLLAAVCYIAGNLADMLLPGYEVYKANVERVTTFPMIAGELGLALWLILKGGKKAA